MWQREIIFGNTEEALLRVVLENEEKQRGVLCLIIYKFGCRRKRKSPGERKRRIHGRHHNEVEDANSKSRISSDRLKMRSRKIYSVFIPCVKLSKSWTRADARGRGTEKQSCSPEEGSRPRQTPNRTARWTARRHGDL